MKILVVGFPRSGTTLTYRIFRDHPEVKKMFFEKWMIKQATNRKQLIKKYPSFKLTCGEKVTWEKRVIGKIGVSTETIGDYCLKWNEWFGSEARIIQIIRHPYDSLNSLVISKRRVPRGPSFDTVYREYLVHCSQHTLDMAQIKNCLTIKYESLVNSPKKTIKEIYIHCGIDNNHTHKEVMNTNRIFNYKGRKLRFDYDVRLSGVIDTFNTIPGIKYGKRRSK